MYLQTVPLGSKYIKTPKMTIRSLKTDHGSSGHDLFYMWPWASMRFIVEKTPVKVLKWIWNLSQCVQSITISQKWLFSHWKWTLAPLDMASFIGGPGLLGALWNFPVEKPVIEVSKCLLKPVPMDLEHPKTPSWAFLTPGLAKKWRR